jgi:hypothetical protein
VGAGVSVGDAVSVGRATVAEGESVSVGRTGAEVGDAHETMRKTQIKESPILVAGCRSMELILLDLELSLNLVSCHPERQRRVSTTSEILRFAQKDKPKQKINS